MPQDEPEVMKPEQPPRAAACATFASRRATARPAFSRGRASSWRPWPRASGSWRPRGGPAPSARRRGEKPWRPSWPRAFAPVASTRTFSPRSRRWRRARGSWPSPSGRGSRTLDSSRAIPSWWSRSTSRIRATWAASSVPPRPRGPPGPCSPGRPPMPSPGKRFAARWAARSVFPICGKRASRPPSTGSRPMASGSPPPSPAAARPTTRSDLKGPLALLLGNEGSGLPAAAEARASVRLSIPVAAPVESLNVGVAAGILLFEAARQRRA